ncbi:hypothetical protein G7Y89_g11563 [Cudoniella acicularis]|uniref:Uncharacterized protein n=1 Tax=Cudoniella acicularis TaxID=354080 RepID=A0A8H4RAP5_9HELO|nr:hypothetical protein G7Y89_g11563 [Cudoniella acicularis]
MHSMPARKRDFEARDKKIAELTETITAKEKKYDDLEKDIKNRERDVKVREDKVKNREEERKSQPRRSTNKSSTESGKELKMARAQWEKEKKAADKNIARLEGELTSLTDNHKILKLDFDAVNSEMSSAKAKAAEHTSDKAVKEELRKLRKERDEFKGLYEANLSTDKIIQDGIMSLEAQKY